jgi:hypothetical protein
MKKAKKNITLLIAAVMMFALIACGSTSELASVKSSVSVGDIIEFGAYEQDNDASNGKEDIEWQVLAKEDNKILVISKYALDAQPYNTEFENVTWETCTLRAWLNETFLDEAFSKAEKSMIQTTEVSADENPYYSNDPGNATKDKIFLLSIDEANKYFASNKSRRCVPTAYAIAKDAMTSDHYKVDGEATCCWWLRSLGINPGLAAFVSGEGSVDYFGDGVHGYDDSVDNICVCPAMWIDLEGEFNDIKIVETAETAQNDSNTLSDYAAAAVGDIIEFGAYEQDNETSNGKETIEWRVLAKEDNKILVISQYALDAQPYNTEFENVTWETCTLRTWLNETFLNEAFNEAEQSMIQTTEVSADKNPDYGTDPGNATKDKIFLLSIDETNKYFASHENCPLTEYAIANGATNNDNFRVDGPALTCCWWLRSPGSLQNNAAEVDYYGKVNSGGIAVDYAHNAVRPEMWIDLDA